MLRLPWNSSIFIYVDGIKYFLISIGGFGFVGYTWKVSKGM